MVNFHPEFVVDENQNRRAVLLPLKEWDRIVSELEELDHIRAYDAAQAQSGERLPFEHDVRKLRGYLKGIDTSFVREGDRG
jgi:hypothetical protein